MDAGACYPGLPSVPSPGTIFSTYVQIMESINVHATIFRRGNKAELFGDGDKLVDEEQELENKLRDLHAVWSLPRSGCVGCMGCMGAADTAMASGNVVLA